MALMNAVRQTAATITPDDLDRLTPDLDMPTVNDLAFRLTGLSGAVLEAECLRLAGAMLDDMRALGYRLGRLEHTVVLALLRAAIIKAAFIPTGRA